METQATYVTSLDGVRGVIVDDHLVTDLGEPYVLVHFENGPQVWVSRAALTQRSDIGYSLPLSVAEIERQQPVIAQKTNWTAIEEQLQPEPRERQQPVIAQQANRVLAQERVQPDNEPPAALQTEQRITHHEDELVLPVIEEQLEIGTRTVSNTLRVRKQVHTREEVVQQPLLHEVADVQHITLNQMVDKPVQVRREGNTVIIPVMEEVLVVEKRLMLKEEIRISMRRDKVQQPQTVTLRREEIVIERGEETLPSTDDGTDHA